MIDFIENIYSKLPKLDPEVSEFIVKVLPYIVLPAGILFTIISVMEIVGTPFISLFTFGNGGGSLIQTLFLINAIGIAQGILMMVAFNGLRKRKQTGWRLTFWSQILWVIAGVISFSPSFVVALLLFYPLFQVKPYYSK